MRTRFALFSLLVVSLLCSLHARAAGANPQASSKDVITKIGESHFEAPLPARVTLRLYVRSGDVDIVGTEDNKISVDVSGRNAEKIEDLKHVLKILDGSAEFHLSGGPRNDFHITIHLPKSCDLYLRVPAGDVSVEGISGNKDIELHAGDLSIHVGNPNEYSHVDASVNAGDLNASPFGSPMAGCFARSRNLVPGNTICTRMSAPAT